MTETQQAPKPGSGSKTVWVVVALIALAMLVLCGGAGGVATLACRRATTPKLNTFSEVNFGCRFSYPEKISVRYNPHGAATRVLVDYDSEPIGGLSISGLPSSTNKQAFVDMGKQYYRMRYKGAKVEYSVYTSKAKREFHHYHVSIGSGSAAKIIERYVNIDESGAGAKGAWRTYSFEFLHSGADVAERKSATRIIVDSFTVRKDPQ